MPQVCGVCALIARVRYVVAEEIAMAIETAQDDAPLCTCDPEDLCAEGGCGVCWGLAEDEPCAGGLLTAAAAIARSIGGTP
jgi:hypothetical protein